ncbi:MULTISPECIES: NAD(P)H-binding protein [Streptomyces]|uniref:Nucleotide-diphosphate-sugar epimerase n=1 Tax=Streptomyces rubiginosohelvolus TaxID=67362 RepID=A0ABQ3C1I9_9ACTN|nr:MULTISPECIES: NAD(P)H-binding protein [Streptomyces]RUP68711.1 NAD(P)H azoreductase [Streptomyces sp. NP10]WST54774.1 NAD(P)H-binding protein [Streptomyces rubiginosohelvolus]GGR78754.1 nucleotide-diphosphate-sugar epimerase [Streptomyces rubiginosohelvolus]GGZ64590.1 nucleotide-diphosphate-sugar epimerase [Streptomyces pluricolorescens]
MTILVTGATGTVGRRVVEQLLERGEHVRALTRDPERAEFPAGVEVVGGDLEDPASLVPALRGVTGLHLITFGGALFAPLETADEILALAKEAGVRRVTVLHGGGDTPMEAAVRASDFAWTVVMPVEFMANALEWAPGIRSEGVVREPFVDRLSAMVHESDIGAVAAVALTEDGHGGQEYLITGPQALTVRDKTAAIGAARGADVELVELTEQQALETWRGQGMPEDVIAFLIDVYRDTPPEGRTVRGTVEKVTGRPARTFAEWAEEHAHAFRAEA